MYRDSGTGKGLLEALHGGGLGDGSVGELATKDGDPAEATTGERRHWQLGELQVFLGLAPLSGHPVSPSAGGKPMM